MGAWARARSANKKAAEKGWCHTYKVGSAAPAPRLSTPYRPFRHAQSQVSPLSLRSPPHAERVRHPSREEVGGTPVPVALEEEVGQEGLVGARVAVVL